MQIYEGEQGYLELLKDILKNGSTSDDRTGVGTTKVFGRMIRFDMKNGFPLLTTKKVWLHGIRTELLWFLSGDTNIRPLVLEKVHIWDEWPFQQYLEDHNLTNVYPKGSAKWKERLDQFIERVKNDTLFASLYAGIGNQAYGKNWRDFGGVDQIENAINLIRHNPNSRRILVSAWNPPEVENMPRASLPPCHYVYQFNVDKDKLSILVNIRSWDVFLGGPFNIASYAMLLHMFAQVTDKTAHEVIIVSGDTHIYKNHFQSVETQLERKPLALPSLWLNPEVTGIDGFKKQDIAVVDYTHHPAISAEIAI